MNHIKSWMVSVEAGDNTDISEVRMEVADLMTLKIEKADLDIFGKELQTQLVPSLEAMSNRIQQLEINQVRILGSINYFAPPVIAEVISGLKGLGD